MLLKTPTQKQVADAGVALVFKEFEKTFKLYAYKDKDRCDLSIKVSSGLVMTYKLTHAELTKFFNEYDIIDLKNDKCGVQLQTQDGPWWFVMHKKHFNAVRITINTSGVDFNFRVDIDDWVNLIEEYEIQMCNPMPWDKEE